MATGPDALIQPPVPEAVRLYTLVFGKHGWDDGVALVTWAVMVMEGGKRRERQLEAVGRDHEERKKQERRKVVGEFGPD